MSRPPSLNLAAHLESGATRLLLLALAHAVPLRRADSHAFSSASTERGGSHPASPPRPRGDGGYGADRTARSGALPAEVAHGAGGTSAVATHYPSRSDERRPRPVDRLPHVSRPGLRSSEPDGSQQGRHA